MTRESKYFKAKPMMKWLEKAKKLSPPESIIEKFWYRGETCFFFGSTGVGKTIYAMQMAHQISQEEKVLYFDFEMTERQLLQRYQNNGKLMPFSDNLIRIEMQKDVSVNCDEIVNEIAAIIKKEEASIIIIDNLTWLLEDTQEAKIVIPFMKKISRLKRELDVSIMIIAHTPKRKPTSQLGANGGLSTFNSPIDLADMAGSAALNNFIDSCYAISKSSKDESLRYIKQLKSRSSEIVHGADNVILCRLEIVEENFLGLSDEGVSSEYEHLFKQSKLERNKEINKLAQAGLSSREIGEKLNMSHTQVQRIKKQEDTENSKNTRLNKRISDEKAERIKRAFKKAREDRESKFGDGTCSTPES